MNQLKRLLPVSVFSCAGHFKNSPAPVCLIFTYFLQDYVNNWRETSLILTSILFVASGIWFIGRTFNCQIVVKSFGPVFHWIYCNLITQHMLLHFLRHSEHECLAWSLIHMYCTCSWSPFTLTFTLTLIYYPLIISQTFAHYI